MRWRSCLACALLVLVPAHRAQTVISNTGWEVDADSEWSDEYEAENVLTGPYQGIWHTGAEDEFPHMLTIDTGAVQTFTRLTYVPRQDASMNGNIGDYEVYVSDTDDDEDFVLVKQGTWADSKSAKWASFAPVSGQYVRLVALSEAGDRGEWASAAQILLLAPDTASDLLAAPDTAVVGEGTTAAEAAGGEGSAFEPATDGIWSPVGQHPLIAVAAAHLPNGNILIWSAFSETDFGEDKAEGTGWGYTQTAIWDPVTGQSEQREVSHTGHDMFCPGTAQLPDGNVHVTGGSNAYETSVYDWQADDWIEAQKMNVPRGYQGACPLPDGRVFVYGGSWSGGEGGKIAEIWSADGGWVTLDNIPTGPIETVDPEGVYRSDNHLWLFPVAPNTIFHAGPSRAMHWIDISTADGEIVDAGERFDEDQMNGNAVMYDAYKILTVAGAQVYESEDNSVVATAAAHEITLSGREATVEQVGSLTYERVFSCATVLPDGKTLVTGGQRIPRLFNDVGATFEPELYDPATQTWTALSAASVPRTYHSVALLLPDGRVMSAGGGLCDPCDFNHPDYEIFTPPYLLTADGSPAPRPTITSAPSAVDIGGTMQVTTDRPVSYFSIIRLSSSTHTVNNDQRRLRLATAWQSGNTMALQIPASEWLALPGYWYLFAIDANGVPSVAEIIQLTV